MKIKYKDEIKKIEGTTVAEETVGRLVILDGDKVAARFRFNPKTISA